MAKVTVKEVEEVDELVTLTKDGEIIKAHPTQVELWVTQGWIVVR